MNDLYGCPGFFDRETGNLLEYKLDALVAEHIKYLKLQIDALQERSIPVIIMTPMPVLGEFPWTHFGPTNELVWELDHRCDYNRGLVGKGSKGTGKTIPADRPARYRQIT
jgi:hypothetical protein